MKDFAIEHPFITLAIVRTVCVTTFNVIALLTGHYEEAAQSLIPVALSVAKDAATE